MRFPRCGAREVYVFSGCGSKYCGTGVPPGNQGSFSRSLPEQKSVGQSFLPREPSLHSKFETVLVRPELNLGVICIWFSRFDWFRHAHFPSDKIAATHRTKSPCHQRQVSAFSTNKMYIFGCT